MNELPEEKLKEAARKIAKSHHLHLLVGREGRLDRSSISTAFPGVARVSLDDYFRFNETDLVSLSKIYVGYNSQVAIAHYSIDPAKRLKISTANTYTGLSTRYLPLGIHEGYSALADLIEKTLTVYEEVGEEAWSPYCTYYPNQNGRKEISAEHIARQKEWDIVAHNYTHLQTAGVSSPYIHSSQPALKVFEAAGIPPEELSRIFIPDDMDCVQYYQTPVAERNPKVATSYNELGKHHLNITCDEGWSNLAELTNRTIKVFHKSGDELADSYAIFHPDGRIETRDQILAAAAGNSEGS